MNVVRFFELMRGKRANSIGEEIIIIIQLIVIWGLILSFGYIAISDATISEFFSIIPKVVSGIFWGSILGYVFLVLTACLVILRLKLFRQIKISQPWNTIFQHLRRYEKVHSSQR